MNKLDMPLQNASWKVEAQVTKASAQSADSGESGQKTSAFAVFDNLLRKMSEKGEGELVRIGPVVAEAKSVLPLEGRRSEDDRVHEGSMEDLLLEPSLDADALPRLSPASGNMVLSINANASVQPSLPQVASPTSQSSPTSQGKLPGLVSSSLLDLVELSTDKAKRSDVPDGLSLSLERKATVIHQETHFKPILIAEAPVVPRPKNDKILPPPSIELANLGDMSAASLDMAQEKTIRSKAPTPQISRETPHQVAAANGDKDPVSSSDLHGVLQRVISAIESNAKRVSLENSGPIRQHDTSAPMMTTKQSDAVLRMLDIQLRPAELGVITVKMRLSGDKLEMELHASREETAEILKRDSEMLSGLLRTSGYRPDTVSIHTSRQDAAHPDNMFGQRQSTNHDASSQFGSSQGGEAGHNGRPRGGGERYQNSSQGGQKNGAEEVTAANRNLNGLYL